MISSRVVRLGVLLLLGITSFTRAVPPTNPQIDTARNKALAWLITQQSGEGYWRTQPGGEVVTTSLVLAALEKAGVKGPTYSKAVGWIANAKAASTDARARQAMALYNAGLNATSSVTRVVAMQNFTSSWGAYAGYAGSFPDTPLALDAVKLTGASLGSLSTAVGFLTSKQNVNGGWPYNATEISAPQSRVVPTAASVATLVRYRTTFVVDTNINNGVTYLKSRQNATTGAIGDDANGTIYETALAYQAIAAANGTADTAAGNALGFIVQQQAADGSWGGDPLSTALALASLPAPAAPLTDTDGDGIPDAVEDLIGTIKTVADGRNLTRGNGNSVAGTNVANIFATGILNTAYNLTLTAPSGGFGVAQWSIVSGSLPPCMTLSWNGILSGTPTAPGTYNFTYQVTDSASPPALLKTEVAQIIVTDTGVAPIQCPATFDAIQPAILQLLLDD